MLVDDFVGFLLYTENFFQSVIWYVWRQVDVTVVSIPNAHCTWQTTGAWIQITKFMWQTEWNHNEVFGSEFNTLSFFSIQWTHAGKTMLQLIMELRCWSILYNLGHNLTVLFIQILFCIRSKPKGVVLHGLAVYKSGENGYTRFLLQSYNGKSICRQWKMIQKLLWRRMAL